MPTIATQEGVFEFESRGTGEPIIFIHGALVADAFRPLIIGEGPLSGFRLLAYRRRGHGGSSPGAGPSTVSDQGRDCRALLDAFGIRRAHVVGHSYGGAIGLQLALDVPELVHSLAVLEPALFVGASADSYREALMAGHRRFCEGAAAAAVVGEFLEARWPGYEGALESRIPGAFTQAVTDAATWFEREIPGLSKWRFGDAEARCITQPVLAVLGGHSRAVWPRFGEAHDWLLARLPDGEGSVVPHTTHFMQVQEPGMVAAALGSFFLRHPIETP